VPDFDTVWQAHKTVERLHVALAYFYEEGERIGQEQLTDVQKQELAREFADLTRSMAALGITEQPPSGRDEPPPQ
jgi:hypothetical protein